MVSLFDKLGNFLPIRAFSYEFHHKIRNKLLINNIEHYLQQEQMKIDIHILTIKRNETDLRFQQQLYWNATSKALQPFRFDAARVSFQAIFVLCTSSPDL